eukprot:3883963-Prymnesium_polylepis.1
MLPAKLGTSNIRTPGTCHACSRKVPSERANLKAVLEARRSMLPDGVLPVLSSRCTASSRWQQMATAFPTRTSSRSVSCTIARCWAAQGVDQREAGR